MQSIEWFKELGYAYVCGYDIGFGETPERSDYRSVVLKDRLFGFEAHQPDIPQFLIDAALSQLENPNIPARNCNCQVYLTMATKVTYLEKDQESEDSSRSSTLIILATMSGWWLTSSRYTGKSTIEPDLVVSNDFLYL